VHGYATIHGVMRTARLSLVNWEGAGACASAGPQARYALSNKQAPDAFHPHYFREVRRWGGGAEGVGVGGGGERGRIGGQANAIA
jgi:hypothetical protein